MGWGSRASILRHKKMYTKTSSGVRSSWIDWDLRGILLDTKILWRSLVPILLWRRGCGREPPVDFSLGFG